MASVLVAVAFPASGAIAAVHVNPDATGDYSLPVEKPSKSTKPKGGQTQSDSSANGSGGTGGNGGLFGPSAKPATVSAPKAPKVDRAHSEKVAAGTADSVMRDYTDWLTGRFGPSR